MPKSMLLKKATEWTPQSRRQKKDENALRKRGERKTDRKALNKRTCQDKRQWKLGCERTHRKPRAVYSLTWVRVCILRRHSFLPKRNYYSLK